MQLPVVLPALLQKNHETTPKLGLKSASNHATTIRGFCIKLLSHLPRLVHPRQSMPCVWTEPCSVNCHSLIFSVH